MVIALPMSLQNRKNHCLHLLISKLWAMAKLSSGSWGTRGHHIMGRAQLQTWYCKARQLIIIWQTLLRCLFCAKLFHTRPFESYIQKQTHEVGIISACQMRKPEPKEGKPAKLVIIDHAAQEWQSQDLIQAPWLQTPSFCLTTLHHFFYNQVCINIVKTKLNTHTELKYVLAGGSFYF